MPAETPSYIPQLAPLGNDVMAHITVGNKCLENGRWKTAAESYELAIRQSPSQTLAHLYLAKCRFQLRDYDRAEIACQAALRLNPELIDALLLEGHLLTIRQDWAEAQLRYARVIKDDSSQAVAHAMLGFVLRRQGSPKLAQESYLTAVRLDKTVFFWWLALAELSNELGDPSLAQLAAERALELNPLLAQAQYQLGVAHQKQGAFDKAEECFTQASQGNAALILGQMQRARHLAETKGSAAVLPLIEVLQTKFPGWAEVPLVLGEAYLTDKNYPAALEAFAKAARLNPGLATPYYKLGLTYLSQNRQVEAREHFLAACEREEQPGPSYFALQQLSPESAVS